MEIDKKLQDLVINKLFENGVDFEKKYIALFEVTKLIMKEYEFMMTQSHAREMTATWGRNRESEVSRQVISSKYAKLFFNMNNFLC